MLRRRVVVTGMGMVSPLGTSVEKSWQALIQGKSGVGRITKFDPTGFDTQIAFSSIAACSRARRNSAS